MKAIVHDRYGRPDVLSLREVDVPVPADDQVLVRVHASSVNPVEWYGVTGPVFSSIAARSTRSLLSGVRRARLVLGLAIDSPHDVHRKSLA